MSNDLTVHQPSGTQLATLQNPVAAMLEQVLAREGSLAESAAAMKELVGLYEHMEAINAKKAFADDMRALQAEMPKVTVNRHIPSKDGTVRSKFADYQHIWDTICPYVTRRGFSVSYDIGVIREPEREVVAVCTVTHALGHSRDHSFGCRVGNGPPNASLAQSDGSARTYAMRGALCAAFNIVVDHDNDARAVGAYITPEQASSLRERVQATRSDEAAFLKYAKATRYEEIRTTQYAVLDKFLGQKERRAGDDPPAAKSVASPTDELQEADKQRQAEEWLSRAHSRPEEIDDIIGEIQRVRDWLGMSKAGELISEIRGVKR